MMELAEAENAALISEIQEHLSGMTPLAAPFPGMLQKLGDGMEEIRKFCFSAFTDLDDPCAAASTKDVNQASESCEAQQLTHLLHALSTEEEPPRAQDASQDPLRPSTGAGDATMLGHPCGVPSTDVDQGNECCETQQLTNLLRALTTEEEPPRAQDGSQDLLRPTAGSAPSEGDASMGYSCTASSSDVYFSQQNVWPHTRTAHGQGRQGWQACPGTRTSCPDSGAICPVSSRPVQEWYQPTACLGASHGLLSGFGNSSIMGYLGQGASSREWARQHSLWSPGNGQNWSGQRGDSSTGQCVAPSVGQQIVAVTRPAQPQGPTEREPRPLEPGTTTLVVRNVPARYRKERLVREWPVTVWGYNMLYLPCSRRGSSFGYVFLNFLTPEYALAFQKHWHGRFLLEHGSNKFLDISQARVQGLAESLHEMVRGEDSRASKYAACSPLVFEGTRVLELDEVLHRFGLEPNNEASSTPQSSSMHASHSDEDRSSLRYL